jgi:hypothetical protein
VYRFGAFIFRPAPVLDRENENQGTNQREEEGADRRDEEVESVNSPGDRGCDFWKNRKIRKHL